MKNHEYPFDLSLRSSKNDVSGRSRRRSLKTDLSRCSRRRRRKPTFNKNHILAAQVIAYQSAARLSENKFQTAKLGRTLSAALAAGFSKEDADKVTKKLQQCAKSMKSDKAYSLALECFKTTRDVSRLGVTSQAVTNMLVAALKKGFDHQEIYAMRSAFMTKAHQSQPQTLAHSYSAAIQEGKGFQEDPGGGAGGGSNGVGHGASGSEDSGSASVGSGSSGGNAGGGSGGSGSN